MICIPCEGLRPDAPEVALMLLLITPKSNSSAKEAARDLVVVSGVVAEEGVKVLEDFINALAIVNLPGTGSAVDVGFILLSDLPENDE